MSAVTVNQCDACGKRVDNGYAVAGWIRIDGSLTRSTGPLPNGALRPSSYQTAYIGSRSGGSHFCSFECLKKKLDELDGTLGLVHKARVPCALCGRSADGERVDG